MNELRFGLEVLTVGFSVVIATLFLLALVLVCFSKFLAPGEKKVVKNTAHEQKQATVDEEKKLDTVDEEKEKELDSESEQQAAMVNNKEQIETIAVGAESSVYPELVAAIAGAMYAEETKQTKPEVIAAITGAYHYLMDVPGSPEDYKSDKKFEDSLWAQTGRTRVVQLRQDFVLLRRGM